MIAALIIGWLVCGIGASGFTYAYFADEFPAVRNHRADLGQALLIGLVTGPIGLVGTFFFTGFAMHGWRLR